MLRPPLGLQVTEAELHFLSVYVHAPVPCEKELSQWRVFHNILSRAALGTAWSPASWPNCFRT